MIDKVTKSLKEAIGNRKPQIAIILGSGLGGVADAIEDKIIIPYSKIKDFPISTVKGHSGQFVVGKILGTEVICMQGRVHLYEGHSPEIINTMIRSLKNIGVEKIFVTNAAGSLNKKMKPGSLMLINDHINFSCLNPLVGINDDNIGPRFPDMTDAYNHKLRKIIKRNARSLGIKIYQGSYFFCLGPNFETAAEIRAIKTLGASAVGMSTVPEVISAVHCGLKVVAISAITNFATGLSKTKQSHEETMTNGEIASKNLTNLIINSIKEL